MTTIQFSLLVTALGAVVVDGANILALFPFPSPSHQLVFEPILRRLAERGHSVTHYTPRPFNDPPPNYKEVLVPNHVQDMFKKVDLIEMGKRSSLGQALSILDIGYYVQDKLCHEKTIRDLLDSDLHFDLIIQEAFFGQESLAAVQHRFGAPSVDVATCGAYFWAYDAAGSPYNPSYMPDFKSPFSDRMSFPERLMNSITAYGTSLLTRYYYLPRVQSLMDRCFTYPGWEKRPSLLQLLANKSLVIQNSHFSTNYAAPSAPHFIEVGGVHIRPRKPLPQDIQAFMDGAKDGVIYFSLGSLLSVSDLVTDKVFKAFLETFKKLKQRVIWKWEKGSFPTNAKNIYVSNWFPQQDILAHNNCRLFITHGGYLSVAESVNFGVPLIGIPFFGDQPKNMKHVTTFGYGLHLDFRNITQESVTWAINEILTNPSYKEAAMRRSFLFQDRPLSPLNNAVYWLEYVIRHKGAKHMRSVLAELPWYKSLLLDVVAFVIALVATFIVGIYLATKTLLKLLCRSGRARATKNVVPTKAKKKTS